MYKIILSTTEEIDHVNPHMRCTYTETDFNKLYSGINLYQQLVAFLNTNNPSS